jgi:hypothetical protein
MPARHFHFPFFALPGPATVQTQKYAWQGHSGGFGKNARIANGTALIIRCKALIISGKTLTVSGETLL